MRSKLHTAKLRLLGLASGALLAIGSPLAAQEAPVKIGVLIGFSGDMGPWSADLHNAMILAAEEINAAGGLLGRTLELVAEDNSSTVDGAMRGATKLVSVEGVSAIVGPESDPIVALLSFAKDQQIPIISTSAGTEVLNKVGGKGRYIYRTNASDSFLGVVHAKLLLEEMGQSSIVMVVENLEGTMSGANTFKAAYEAMGGKIIDEIILAPGQAIYQSEVKAVAAYDPEMVFLAVGQTAGVSFVKQAYQRGHDWKYWVTAELQSPDFVNAVGVELVQGAINPVSSAASDSEAWARFSDAFEARFGEPATPGFYQAESYDAVMVAALAIEAAGSDEGQAIDAKLTEIATPGGTEVIGFAEGRDALAAGSDINYEGASGSINFNEFGNVTVPATRMLQVAEDGTWVTLKVIDSTNFPAN
ncbi:MAG: ABC transporter substrate-binding protein [Paracoccaceae bacterium]